MRTTRRDLLAGIAGSVVGSLTATACSRPPRAKTLVRVALTARVGMGPIHLADELGLFRDEGLEIQFVEFPAQQNMIPALVGNLADAALVGATPAICNAIARGARMRIVAGREALKPGCMDQGALYYRRSKFPNGPERAADWKGARVALPSEANMVMVFYLDQLLASLGIPASAVETHRMTPEEAVAATSAGNLDLFFGSGRPEFLKGGMPKSIARADTMLSLLGEFQSSYVIFGAKLLDGDPALGTAFMRAYLRGVRRFAAGETPRFFDDLAARLHLDPQVLKAGCRGNISVDGVIRERDLERWLAWGTASKIVTKPVTVAELVDSRFQREAVRGL